MKIFTASISFDRIDDVRSLTAVVRRWYPKNNPGAYAVVGDRLIVANSLTNDTDKVLEMVAFIGNHFSRGVKVHFGELNLPDYANFQNGDKVATPPSDVPASAGAIG
ncbi:MAG: hypothetical protein J6S75_01940 [Thermoguttaceae bacterium]|nr:hypothetical protein [Thermoguttaceae bacterium]